MGVWKEVFCRQAANDKFPIFEPYYNLTRQQKDMLWHGLPSEKGKEKRDRVCIDSFFNMVKENQYKIQYRVMLSRYRGKTICPVCHGTRLKKEATWVKIGGMSIVDLVEMPVTNLKMWFDNLQISKNEAKIAKRLLAEIRSRLQFLLDVGLGYLTLNRASNTLSGRREPAHQSNHITRQFACGITLYSGRAKHRSAQQRHGPSDSRIVRVAAASQYGDCGGARRRRNSRR